MLQRLAQQKNIYLKAAAILAVVAVATLLLADSALATDVTLNSPEFAPIGNTSIPAIIGRIIGAILALTGVIALVMFIYGGFLWMTSAGNSEQVGKAKKTIVWSVLGLVLIFSSYALVNFVMQALNQVNP